MEWIGLALVLGIIVWMALVIISVLRNKKTTIDSLFALRMLPAGRDFTLAEEWQPYGEHGKTLVITKSRPLSPVDARIAYTSYQLIRAKEFDKLPLSGYMQDQLKNVPDLVHEWASREEFISLHDFVTYVAQFDSTLKATLRAREVDPSEYELDRSAWEDDDKDDNNR